jgi:hypothetical protein
MEFDCQFDAVVGRFVLMYYPDPIDAVRRLLRYLRPAGLFVFQEFDFAALRSFPMSPTYERAAKWVRQTLSASGARTSLGLELYTVFSAAGLPGPSLRIDSLIGGGLEFPFEIVAETIESLLPKMVELKLATPAVVNLPTLAERIRREVVTSNGVVLSPGLVGAWSRKAQ